MLKFFKDFLIYGFASVFGKVAAVFLMPIYTGILTTEEYGAMALITSCKGVLDLISNLNIHSGIAREYYEEGIDRKDLVSTGLFSILGISISILVLMILSRNYWEDIVLSLDTKYDIAFILMLISIPAGSLQMYFSILTRYKKKPMLYALGTIIHLTIQIGLSIMGVVVFKIGITGIFLGILLAELFSILFYSFINREYIAFRFKAVYLKCALKFSIPTLPAILAGWLDTSVGQVLIGRFISKSDLGVYSIAVQLSSVFTIISAAFHNVWSPFLYENYSSNTFKTEIRRLFLVMVFLLSMLTLFISIFSKDVVLLLSNKNYSDAAFYLIILTIPMSFYLMFPFASSGVSISRDTKYIGISYIIGSIGNILTLFILIRLLGVFAVPVCLSISRIITYSILYKISEKKIMYNLPNQYFCVLILIAVIGYICQIFCSSVIFKIIICTILSYVVWRIFGLSIDLRLSNIVLTFKKKRNV